MADTSDFFAGLTTIHEELDRLVGEKLQPVWHYGRLVKGGEIPESVKLVVKSSRGAWEGALSREQIEDSASRIDRGDVHKLVGEIAAKLAGNS